MVGIGLLATRMMINLWEFFFQLQDFLFFIFYFYRIVFLYFPFFFPFFSFFFVNLEWTVEKKKTNKSYIYSRMKKIGLGME